MRRFICCLLGVWVSAHAQSLSIQGEFICSEQKSPINQEFSVYLGDSLIFRRGDQMLAKYLVHKHSTQAKIPQDSLDLRLGLLTSYTTTLNLDSIVDVRILAQPELWEWIRFEQKFWREYQIQLPKWAHLISSYSTHSTRFEFYGKERMGQCELNGHDAEKTFFEWVEKVFDQRIYLERPYTY